MLKAFLLVTLVVGAHGDLLSPGLLPVTPAVRELLAAINETFTVFQRRLSEGLEVDPPGLDQARNTTLLNFQENFTLTAGIVALPLPFLCSQPSSSILLKLICVLGALDCTYVHNKYSGHCGTSANPVNGTTQTLGQVFICNELETETSNFRNVNDADQCGPVLGSLVDPLLNLAIKNFLRVRLTADLCPRDPSNPTSITYRNTGCIADCRNNHQYSSGVCTTGNNAVDTFVGEVNADFQCICSP